MVIGSGAARNAPDDADRQDCESGFVAVASAVAKYASQYGITIAPESLNRSETNVGNNLGTLARDLKDAGVGYTADSYHIFYEWHANFPDETVPSADLMAQEIPFAPSHVHIANLPRFAPKPSDPMCQAFASRLLELGYDGRVSLEYRRGEDFPSELESALTDLKDLFRVA